ncbi:CLUMA_CG009582, isoform A [Clunio marinus]|uniref:CLUMA_CG009582, isoform A n=1 Tax=Clunio marinus TaxID=568069 RepID=A0A1J1ICI9_9DIPT|nr:CLUMA_CG009582, isoform A [Clunio marinus]
MAITERCDQSNVECETVSLDESKKFKIININQATILDEPRSKFDHKAQLIEIDKLLINTQNGTKAKSVSRIGVWHQVQVTLALILLTAGVGMPIGYSVVILPQLLNHPNDSLAMDYEMASWVASIHSAATPIGSLASVPIMDAYGRKTTLLLSVAPLIVGWSSIALAESHSMILIGRIICGIAVGLMSAPAQILLAEMSQANLRGMLVSVPFVSYSSGILLVYALGSLLHWRIAAWCGLLLPIFSFMAISVAPESPTWLARKGYYDKARKALTWLRDSDETAKAELKETIERIENEKNQIDKSQSLERVITQPSVLKPLILINVFNVLQILSGTYIIVFYAVDIITEICNFGDTMEISTMQSAVITAVIRLLLTVIYCVLLLKCHRRKLYLSSTFFSGIFALMLSLFLYIKGNTTKSFHDLIIIGILMLLYISFNSPLMLVPGIMVGELLPLRVRHWSGIIFTAFNLMLFGITKLFPTLKAMLKSRGLFLMFGISSLLASLLFYMFLPETKNRTLNEIEDYYQQRNWIWQSRTRKFDKSDQS